MQCKHMLLLVIVLLGLVHVTPQLQAIGHIDKPNKIFFMSENMGDASMPCNIRSMDIVRYLHSCGHEVTMFSAGPAFDDVFEDELIELNISFEYVNKKGFYTANYLKDKKNNFDIVFMYQWYWTKYSLPERYLITIREMLPNAKIILLTDDVHSKRAELIYYAFQSLPRLDPIFANSHLWRIHRPPKGEFPSANAWRWIFPTSFDIEYPSILAERDEATYERIDYILTATEKDWESMIIIDNKLINKGGTLHFTHNLTNMPIPKIKELTKYDNRYGISFIGYGMNPTNRLALEWFFTNVYPILIIKNPEFSRIPFYLVGSVATDGMLSLIRNTDAIIILTGRMNDDELPTFLGRTRVSISPSIANTGILTKILYSLLSGTPVIATSISSEGYYWKSQEDLFNKVFPKIDTAEEFANMLNEVYNSDERWKELISNSILLLDEQFKSKQFNKDMNILFPYCYPREDTKEEKEISTLLTTPKIVVIFNNQDITLLALVVIVIVICSIIVLFLSMNGRNKQKKK